MLRGQIYYIRGKGCLGVTDVKPARPAIIVTSDALIDALDKVQVVYLTTKPQHDLPCHAVIKSTGTQSTALCEQIAWVDKTLIGDFCGIITPEESERLDIALMVALGIDLGEYEYAETDEETEDADDFGTATFMTSEKTAELLYENIRVAGERDAYKAMVEKLLEGGKA